MDKTYTVPKSKTQEGRWQNILHVGRVFLSFIFYTPTSTHGCASLPLVASIFETRVLAQYTLNFACCLYLFIYWLHSIFWRLLQVSMCRAALFFQWLYDVVGVFLDKKYALLSVTISRKAEWQSGKNTGFTSRLGYLFGCAAVNKLLTFF